ncbi:hypothetical protein HYDPIDRAFT_29004 [Hydnomerulius pinastri MD-312]|uniref:Unplaced genomic scaffold scaffold_14, whole genome shotgun sequence n=1 Tax=Hydnomerulius pinastri MD-312 TaxID=994086 RepID=A0A0C9WEQ5_9AGAM|nr:hypothetical protein HYDPIDRAFT_29004 [Hydnomerulius pinastri MD-312]
MSDFEDYLDSCEQRSSPPPLSPRRVGIPSSPEMSTPEAADMRPDALGEPEGHNTSTPDEVSAAGPDTQTLEGAAKRPLGLLQYAETQAVAKKLKPEGKTELVKYATAAPATREVMQYAMLLHIAETLPATGKVAAGSWEIPTRVKKNIDKYAFRIVLSPTVAIYSGNPPLKTLMGLVSTKLWGLPKDVRSQDEKWDKLVDHARGCLTQRRSDVKGVIENSIGALGEKKTLDIVALCQKLATYGRVETNINITPQFCARIAYLRQRLQKHPKDSNYWKIVDVNLANMRAKAKNDPTKISKWFASILRDDRNLYGQGREITNEPSDEQKEIDHVLTSGEFVDIDLGAGEDGNDN